MRKQRTASNPLPTDVMMTLGDLGVHIEKVSRDEAWAICPNPKHFDNDPSWSINLNTGEHFCFACGWGGNYVFLVEKMLRLDPEAAEAWVRKRGGISVVLKKMRGEVAYTKKQAQEVDEADLVFFDTRIPRYALDDRDLVQESCEAYGVRWDRWIIPIRDPETGRLMGWQEKGKNHFLNYPDNLEKSLTLFGYHLLGDTAYLEESPLDAVRLHSYSVEGAVSGYGVHVSDYQMDLITDRAKRLYVCLDNDEAGRRKEAELWRQYRGKIKMYFANYDHTDKKDHGEMSPEEIEESLSKAIPALRFRP
jgi:DNA primase